MLPIGSHGDARRLFLPASEDFHRKLLCCLTLFSCHMHSHLPFWVNTRSDQSAAGTRTKGRSQGIRGVEVHFPESDWRIQNLCGGGREIIFAASSSIAITPLGAVKRHEEGKCWCSPAGTINVVIEWTQLENLWCTEVFLHARGLYPCNSCPHHPMLAFGTIVQGFVWWESSNAGSFCVWPLSKWMLCQNNNNNNLCCCVLDQWTGHAPVNIFDSILALLCLTPNKQKLWEWWLAHTVLTMPIS